MNKTRKEKIMSRRTSLMNLNQGTNEKVRKTHRSICDKSIKNAHLSIGIVCKMRGGPNRMARNPEKEIMSLNELNSSDPRIRTPLDRRPNDV